MGKIMRLALAVIVGSLTASVSLSALAQVTSRYVVANGTATSVKILPGQSTSMDVRIDAPATQTIGTAFRLTATGPGAAVFTITARSFAGSPYTAGGTPDHCPAVNVPAGCPAIGAGALDGTNPLLDPSNNLNLGRNVADLAFPAAAGTNILAVNLTLTSDVTTPLGVYTIAPLLGGASTITDDQANDFPMTGLFEIIVGQTLSVTKSGVGTGLVAADSGAISCGATCADIYPGTVVTLTANAAPGSVFTGWSGAGCAGTGTCVVTVDAAKSVNADFAAETFALSVNKIGAGAGTVTSNIGGLNCGATCSVDFASGSVVTLTAAANATSRFIGWTGGGCSGTGTCVVTVTAPVAVTANFVPTFVLTVNKTGAGSGTVTSDMGTINCGATCVNTYDSGTVVTLTAVAAASSRFTGWSGGGCSGTGTCLVTMDATVTVTANFVPTYVLTVNKSGSGTGTVTSDVGTINCGATCSNTYDGGTVVTLTATPDATFVFAGWSGGGCSGTGTCQVTLNAATTVTATFAPTFSVTVNKTGSGSGTVTSNVGGIDCGATCSVTYPSGTVVTLTVVANAGSVFTGWSGSGCSGTGTCVVTVDAAKTVTANFVATHLLSINKDGAGSGTVTSNVGGINCGPTCSATFNDGTAVILTATPAAGSVFSGWSGGGCSGTGTCNVTMTAATTVTATFTPQFVLTVAKSGNGTGTVTSDVGGINCGTVCAAGYTSGAIVTLTATPGVGGTTFTGWSGGGCSGTGTCVVTVTAATTVTADFNDSSPPSTTLLTTPPNPSNQALAQFTFSSNEPGTFECSIDGSAFVACTSPASYTVGNGAHTFTVRARDLGGNVDPEPPTYQWTAAGIVTTVNIPTLSEWMLVLLALVLGGLGMQAHRRRG